MVHPIYYELGVLAKAIHFKNLSAAALHVGLSQPQLSRIIAKIEEELKVVLLDRSAKRKSGWTPLAFQMASLFENSAKRLDAELQGVSNNQMVAELRIGALEGLSSFAVATTKSCFEKVAVKKITVDIFDLNEIEAHFLSGNLDLIFSVKTPGRQKFKHLYELGFQTLEKISTNKKYGVFSTFEFGKSNKKEHTDFDHVLVSNSLALRKEWLNTVGGMGFLPTETKKAKSKDNETVYLIGSELLSPILWAEIVSAIEES